MEKKYYITADLEKTLIGWIEQFNKAKIKIDEKIREKIINIINNSFKSNVVEFISYDNIYSFFKEEESSEEFIIWLDDKIYIENPDFSYSSTRIYNNKNSIIENPSNYRIRQRNWKNLIEQNLSLINTIKYSWKNEVIVCDDWLFSWDTLSDVISDDIKKYVKEIRVILNFSWKDNLNWIPIKSMLTDSDCIDWLDERDLFYWVKNSWATFINSNWQINWLPYIVNKKIANKKASIPLLEAWKFCENMLDVNKELWWNVKWWNVKLEDLKRISYLKEKYNSNCRITEILELEKNNI
jgi:hypothetical protein